MNLSESDVAFTFVLISTNLTFSIESSIKNFLKNIYFRVAYCLIIVVAILTVGIDIYVDRKS